MAKAKSRIANDLAAKGFKLGQPVFMRIFKMSGELEVWMKKNGKAGVPVYAFYKDAESEPIFLPELLTRRKILEIVNPDKY